MSNFSDRSGPMRGGEEVKSLVASISAERGNGPHQCEFGLVTFEANGSNTTVRVEKPNGIIEIFEVGKYTDVINSHAEIPGWGPEGLTRHGSCMMDPVEVLKALRTPSAATENNSQIAKDLVESYARNPFSCGESLVSQMDSLSDNDLREIAAVFGERTAQDLWAVLAWGGYEVESERLQKLGEGK